MRDRVNTPAFADYVAGYLLRHDVIHE
ncbi:hypothetical protein BCEN4_2240002 [Burkholderia cenocepacia]|nr:hypothetical protein BCEN4_2240002 [Burkholderia cenocepacia]